VGGISILGTTGIVKPFSHEAYEETIQTALSVAASGGCREVVLSTGGKSERFAREVLSGRPAEAFVQVADFFAFSVAEARRMGFAGVVHSAFFGKVVKMAQGHAYTHAHKVPLDLNPVAGLAREMGYDEDLCRELASANTARHALELLFSGGAADVVTAVARGALKESRRLAGERLSVRLLLFDYDGALLTDTDTDGDTVTLTDTDLEE
jgi:cobalt-precorrin-5B (C1)-methyltransferase